MNSIIENIDLFGILLVLTFIMSFQIYFLIVSVYNRKVIFGSFVVLLVMIFLGVYLFSFDRFVAEVNVEETSN